MWNRPPSVYCPNGLSPVVEVERCAQAASDANLDGRYTFKRRRGCAYRAPVLPPSLDPSQVPTPLNQKVFLTLVFKQTIWLQIPIERHLFKASLCGPNGSLRSPVLVRKRIGRGGRVIYDRAVHNDSPRVPKVFDPFDEDYLEDTSV